jgi:ADP-heptose:LPS heptosyltransferase
VAKEIIATKTETGHEICPKCKGSGSLRPNIQIYSAPVLRELWAVAAHAAIVVAPDSMMVHVTGCQEVPCVGLWGPCDPARRVKYYKNHYPVWKREVCPYSPCFAYTGTFPRYCPPRPHRAVCECLGAVNPQDVIDQIKKVIPLTTP